MNGPSGIIHKNLCGSERLHNVVHCLGNSCPWTQSKTSNEMLGYLESEVHELREELLMMESKSSSSSGAEESATKKAVVSELGDILFDVLMLEMLMRREYDIGVGEAWQAAAEKVERRTPYMKEWGDGKSVVRDAEEAVEMWMEVKRLEKLDQSSNDADADANGSKKSVRSINLKDSAALKCIKRHSSLLGGMMIGFALGFLSQIYVAPGGRSGRR